MKIEVRDDIGLLKRIFWVAIILLCWRLLISTSGDEFEMRHRGPLEIFDYKQEPGDTVYRTLWPGFEKVTRIKEK